MLDIMSIKKYIKNILGYSPTNQHWCRVVMDKSVKSFVDSLEISNLNVLEISGNRWKSYQFNSYKSLHFPQFDICAKLPPYLHDKYDLIIAEQVFEHIKQPQYAVGNVYKMLKKNGYFVISTPFLMKRHDFPIDCSRWTELGLYYLLENGGFSSQNIQTYSWGNKACLISNLDKWIVFNKYQHSLKNNIEFPVVVWSFSKK